MTDTRITMQRFLPSLLVAGLLLLPMTATVAQDQPDQPAPESTSPADESTTPAELAALYTPPAENDAEAIKAWVEKVSQTPAPGTTPAALREHFGKLEKAADAVIARDVPEEGLIQAIRLKVGANTLTEQFGDTTAAKRKSELITKLKQDPRPAIAVQGRLLDAETAIGQLQPDDDKAAQQVIDQVVKLLQEKPVTDSHVAVAYAAAETIELNASEKLATSAYKLFAKYLKASPEPNHASVVEMFEGSARRLNLVGNTVEIEGKTLDKKPFNLEEYKGKVVLVDFWATWCAPCLEELPNLKAMYEKHHEAGLEIVGVNLDDNLGRVGAFVAAQEIQWPQLVSEAADEHPVANYYGVYQIPSTFLIGRDGKVVATDLFGEDLQKEIERLMKTDTGD